MCFQIFDHLIIFYQTGFTHKSKWRSIIFVVIYLGVFWGGGIIDGISRVLSILTCWLLPVRATGAVDTGAVSPPPFSTSVFSALRFMFPQTKCGRSPAGVSLRSATLALLPPTNVAAAGVGAMPCTFSYGPACCCRRGERGHRPEWDASGPLLSGGTRLR